MWGSLGSVMAYALDCDIVVSEFQLQSGYYVYIRTNTLENGMNQNPLFLFPPAKGLNSSTTVLLQVSLWH